MVEYIVIAAVVALAALAGYRAFGGALERKATDEGQHVTSLTAYNGTTRSTPPSTTPPSSTTPPPTTPTPAPATPPAAPPPPPPAPAPTNPVLSGHGSYDPINGFTQVPPGTTIVMPTWHNVPISDSYGGAIESGQAIHPSVYPEMDGQHVYPPGSLIPNYTLHPPTGLNIQSHPTLGAPQTVTSDTNLDSLLQPNQGQLSWAACMVDFYLSPPSSIYEHVPSFTPQGAQPNGYQPLPGQSHPNFPYWGNGVFGTPVPAGTPIGGTTYAQPTPPTPPTPPPPPPAPPPKPPTPPPPTPPPATTTQTTP